MSIVARLKEIGWGPVRLARALKIKPQAVSQWKCVPADRVLRVEKLTGISRHDLNPSVFGKAPKLKAASRPEAVIA